MEKKTTTMHFSIGEDFGELITSIAREKAIYDHDLSGSLKVLQDSLIGLPEIIAVEILVGIKELVTDVDDQSNSLIDGKEAFDKFNLKKVSHLVYNLNLEARKLNYWIKEYLSKADRERISVPADLLAANFLEDASEPLLSAIEENFLPLRDALISCRKFVLAAFMKIKFYKELRLKLEEHKIEVPKRLKEAHLEIPEFVETLHGTLSMSTSPGLLETIKEEVKKDIEQFDNYMAANKEIDKIAIKGIEPVDPIDGWDAGWIAQDGTYYALNGEIANMLHNQLEDMMLEAEVIPKDFGGEINGAAWLERQGWVKQHGNHMLYEGYNNHKYGEKYEDVPISKEQLEVITTICRHHHGGVVWPGINPANKCSVLSWARSSPVQFRMKWFAY